MSNIVRPQSPFQVKYLNSNAKILVVGGAAGSSKSYVGLMRHLRWAEDPLYNGYCIRKNSNTLMKAGGLFQEAIALYSKVYPNLTVRWKDQRIVFPSGASVTFAHYENDAAYMQYQGLQLSNVFYDEATHASEEHIWWLVSRLRTAANVNPGIWLSCNPDPDSFLFDWVKWWLYPEGHPQHGIADPEKNGVTRYCLRINGDMVWGDTPEELTSKYGEDKKPIAFQVLLGTLMDNPTLMEMQPEYKSNLEALPEVEMRRLLLGDWTAREEGSTYFQRSWCGEEALMEPPKSEIVRTVRAYDFAGTLKSSANPSPDYTACVKISKLKNGNYFVHDVQRTRILYGDWEKFILDNAARDGRDCDIIIPLDPGASAKLSTSLLTRAISERGYRIRTMRATQAKLDRFRPFSSLAMNGHVQFLKGCAYDFENNIEANNTFMYRELEAFNGKKRSGESGHDDICDAISDAIGILAQRQAIPSMVHALTSTRLSHSTPFDN
ncbi:terminase large subunit [Pseudomonas phage phiPMW]|uniref:Terminase large subunit n=1 Tax=Pseudomonas phage phiPMW TaxID=1815582 RepID=A0A1S5R1F8_9CAUD|nr:terminase large subunit [Pseudomonas phage phiPMW]ANA49251.1 terminase large subunit [Pseudomonas phage phiPMW]